MAALQFGAVFLLLNSPTLDLMANDELQFQAGQDRDAEFESSPNKSDADRVVSEVDIERLREKNLAEKTSKERRPLNIAPINSIDDAIVILTEGPNVRPNTIWVRAIKYLADYPEAALPKLIQTLDGEDRDHPISKLAFALRAIGDARAVPALIRALPRTLQPGRSDFALLLDSHDNELHRFIQKHDLGEEQGGAYFDYGRAFREVVGSLRRLTGQEFNEMQLVWIQFSGTEGQKRLKQEQFNRVTQQWVIWWEANWQNFVSDAAYEKVGVPDLFTSRPHPIVTRKLPTGPNVKLINAGSGGIIHSVHDTGEACFVDLDTSRQAGWPHDLPSPGQTRLDSPELLAWVRQEGFDVVGITYKPEGETEPLYCLLPFDLRAWQINVDQHRRLPEFITGKQPYPLRQPVDLLVPRREIPNPRDPKHSGDSFLFVTREGTAGVLRMTAQVIEAKPVSADASSDDSIFQNAGFRSGVKYVLDIVSAPAIPN